MRGVEANLFDFFYIDLLSFVDTLAIGFLIMYVYTKRDLKKSFIFQFCNLAGIASLITLFLILNPSVNEFVRDRLLKVSEFNELIAFRAFGFSEGLTFAYGITQGIALAVAIFYFKEKKILLALIPVHIITIMFNARIGLVPPLLIILYMIFSLKKTKSLVLLGGITFGLMVLLFSLPIFKDYEKTIKWGLSFFVELGFFSSNEKSDSSNVDVLLNNMIILPTNFLEIIFGSGKNLFYDPYKNSDIGYILQLNFGGVIYILLLFSLIFYMYFRLKIKNVNNKWFNFLFLATILITNLKGNALVTSPSFRLLFLFYIYFILTSYFVPKQKIL